MIYAAGTITSGKSGYDPVNGAVARLRHARSSTSARRGATASVRAIVLRIDSPGGSATASDAIWRELMIAKNERADRPIVASMSDLAASGGYYIAMPAQAIVAQPSTLTGSIGIFGGKFVTGGVYEKLGAHIESTSIGRHAEINSPARPYNADEVKKLEEQLQAFYDQFVEKVADVAPQHAGEDRRAGAGPRVDRPAGEGERPGRRARRPRSRRSRIAKERAKIAADSDVELVVYPPREELLRAADRAVDRGEPVGRRSARWLSANLSSGRARGAARDARPAGDVPPRRAAGADAVYVLTLKQAQRLRAQGLSLEP